MTPPITPGLAKNKTVLKNVLSLCSWKIPLRIASYMYVNPLNGPHFEGETLEKKKKRK